MEAVGHHRRAEQKLDLAAGHADLDLDDVLVVEQVALLNVDAVDAGRERQDGESDGRRLEISCAIRPVAVERQLGLGHNRTGIIPD